MLRMNQTLMCWELEGDLAELATHGRKPTQILTNLVTVFNFLNVGGQRARWYLLNVADSKVRYRVLVPFVGELLLDQMEIRNGIKEPPPTAEAANGTTAAA